MAVTRLALLALACVGPSLTAALFFEDFSSGWDSRWAFSSDEKYSGKFVTDTPKGLETAALKVPQKALHYGLTAKLAEPADPAKGLVLQYELKLSDGLTCGGAYLKLLNNTEGFDPAALTDGTPYSVMFGPDKCGSTNKVHLILRHKAPDGEIEEKHLNAPPSVETDKDTHVYTMILKPDNTYQVLIDGEEKKAGSILEDFTPAVNPAEEIDDAEDFKPSDWVDTPKIPDPEATKPEDWDEDAPASIPDEDAEKPEGWLDDEPAEVEDPEATKPEDWDEEEDGDWEAPKVPNSKCTSGPGCGEWKRPTKANPEYKGKWHAALIDNPEYKGVWAPRRIPNPRYFVDETPLAGIGHVGGVAVEIWTMDEGYYFSNVLITDDAATAEKYRTSHWAPKKALEDAEKEVEEAAAKAKAEAEDKAAAAKEAVKGLPGTDLVISKIKEILDLPQLAALKPHAQPVLTFLEEKSWAVYAGLGGLATLLLLPLLSLLGGKKKAVPEVVLSKKKDVTSPDDVAAAPSVPLAAATEVEVEEEEDAKLSKRRTRRET